MNILLMLCSIALLMFGHFVKIIRWSRFIKLYEYPQADTLLRAMSLGYALNFVLPFKLGDLFRAYYSGRRMKNGVGFSLATVIMDRFLDVLAVTVLFAVIYAASDGRELVLDSARFYFIATAVILAGLVFVRGFSTGIKRLTMAVCSIFNDRLKLKCEKFFWSLINTFRDLRRVNLWLVLGETVLMWTLYIASYALLGIYMTRDGSEYDLVEIIITLFSRSNLDLSALKAAAVSSGVLREQLIIAAYMLIPPAILFLLTMTGRFRSARLPGIETDGQYLNVLPQIEEADQLSFLNDYFSSRRPELIKRFISINRDISIIADCSSGSNASTILCMDKDEIFYRKYAFGEDGDKLADQLIWLKAHSGSLPLCEIIRDEHNSDYCCYDMRYRSEAVGMFQFIHSHPIAASRDILLSVLDAVRGGLYTENRRPADARTVDKYIASKVEANIELIRASRELHELLDFETLVINHREYRNLPALLPFFSAEHLRAVFSRDSYCDIHGDLTVENIICTDGADDRGFYLIDPNTGNIHDSEFLDYAKLLQSLHGGYEFMTKTSAVSVAGNRVDFIFTRSTAYDELFAALREYLERSFSAAEVESIFCHELVHWLRLMPYKLRKDLKRAPMFYAGLVMVANDVYDRFCKE